MRRRRIWSALCAFMAGISLVACVTHPGMAPATSEGAEEKHRVWVVSEDLDPYDLDVPEGWEPSHDGIITAKGVTFEKNPERGNESASINIYRRDPGLVLDYVEGGNPVALEDLVTYWFTLHRSDGVTELHMLPEREIAGERAMGFSYVDILVPHQKAQRWYVLRHDGLWQFILTAAPEDQEIPQELFAMLDSFRWIERAS